MNRCNIGRERWGQLRLLELSLVLLLAMRLTLSTAFMENPALCNALCGDVDEYVDDDDATEDNDVPVLRARSGWQARPPPMAAAPQWRPPPPPMFRPPQQQFRPPQQQFRPPQQQFRPPQQQFRPPQQQFRPPQQGYRPPQPPQPVRPNYQVRPHQQNGFVPPPVRRPNRNANPWETRDTYGPDGWPLNKVWRNPGTTRPDPKIVAAFGNYFASSTQGAFEALRAKEMARRTCDYKYGNNYCVPKEWLTMQVPPRPIYAFIKRGKGTHQGIPGATEGAGMFPELNLPLRPPPPPRRPVTTNPKNNYNPIKVQSNARPEAAGLPYVNIRQTDARCTGGNSKDPSRC